jgi:hypothetical protein
MAGKTSRKNIFHIRLSDAELRAINMAAKSVALPASSWVRMLAMAAAFASTRKKRKIGADG